MTGLYLVFKRREWECHPVNGVTWSIAVSYWIRMAKIFPNDVGKDQSIQSQVWQHQTIGRPSKPSMKWRVWMWFACIFFKFCTLSDTPPMEVKVIIESYKTNNIISKIKIPLGVSSPACLQLLETINNNQVNMTSSIFLEVDFGLLLDKQKKIFLIRPLDYFSMKRVQISFTYVYVFKYPICCLFCYWNYH